MRLSHVSAQDIATEAEAKFYVSDAKESHRSVRTPTNGLAIDLLHMQLKVHGL